MKTRFAAILATLFVFTIAAHAAAPADNPKPAKKSEASPALAALDKSVSADLADQPLTEIISQLSTQAKVQITVDRSVLLMYGDPNQFIGTLQVKDVPLKQALRKVLSTFNMSYGVVGDDIFISTDDNVVSKQISQRVDVDAEGATFRAAIRDLARQTGVNIVVDARAAKQADASISLTLRDVPLDAAVRLLAETADLRSVRVSNVLFVTTSERAEKLKADVNSDQKPANPGIYPPGGPIALPAIGIGGGAAGAAPAVIPPNAVPADRAVPEDAPKKAD